MPRSFLITSSIILIALAGCSKPRDAEVAPAETAATPQPSFRQIDACSLLTSAEIESMQGEAVTGTTPSGGALRGFPSTQCVFVTVTPVNSVSLVITQTGAKSAGRSVRDFWKETFQRGEAPEKEAGEKKDGEEEDEKKSPPQKVDDLGDEAFWMGTQVSTALYVLKGDSFLRISVGGAGDQAAKLEKSRKLAAFALRRL